MTKTFLKPKDSQQNVEIKANWGRARKQYGPRATDIVVATHKNPTVDVSIHWLFINILASSL